MLLHIGYVATATAFVTVVLRRGHRRPYEVAAVTAFGLWLIAGLTVLPYVGWGLLGLTAVARAALGVLAVHVAYVVFLWIGFWLAFGRGLDGRGASGTAYLAGYPAAAAVYGWTDTSLAP